MDLESLKGLKDATPEDKKLAEELIQAEEKAGISHPQQSVEGKE